VTKCLEADHVRAAGQESVSGAAKRSKQRRNDQDT
jgi:hypothetical protein